MRRAACGSPTPRSGAMERAARGGVINVVVARRVPADAEQRDLRRDQGVRAQLHARGARGARGTGVQLMLVCPGLHPHRVPRARRARRHRRARVPVAVGRRRWSPPRCAISTAAARCRSRACSTRPPPRSRASRRPGSRGASPVWSSSDRGERRVERHRPRCCCCRAPTSPASSRAVADFVYRHGGNIVDAQQHTDRTDGVFFQRVEFAARRLRPRARRDRAGARAARRALRHAVRGALLRRRPARRRAGVEGGALPRRPAGALARVASSPSTSPVVISNHADHAEVAEWFGVDVRAPAGHAPTPSPSRSGGAGGARRARHRRWWCSPATCRS